MGDNHGGCSSWEIIMEAAHHGGIIMEAAHHIYTVENYWGLANNCFVSIRCI